eukprot:3938160-Rhodomonas_salina.1
MAQEEGKPSAYSMVFRPAFSMLWQTLVRTPYCLTHTVLRILYPTMHTVLRACCWLTHTFLRIHYCPTHTLLRSRYCPMHTFTRLRYEKSGTNGGHAGTDSRDHGQRERVAMVLPYLPTRPLPRVQY